MDSLKRDYSIDILKCLAAVIITWSHFELPLGKYSILATGGSFGDCLFFFCSGYTLLLAKKSNGFFNWYKKRINRIYPTVLSWAFISCLIISNNHDMVYILTSGGGYFVSCIMVFYIILYPIMTYGKKHLYIILIIVTLITGLSYYLLDTKNEDIFYNWKWSTYFVVMLLGTIAGNIKYTQPGLYDKISPSKSIIVLIISIATYYILLYIERAYPHLDQLNPLNIFPQIGVTLSLYNLCNLKSIEKIYYNKFCHAIIMTIGGLCLEIYIVQPSIITDKFNNIFPLNLIIIFIAIVISAYVLKCLSRIWSQTFKDGDYDLAKIFKPW